MKDAEKLIAATVAVDTITHCKDCKYYTHFDFGGECSHPCLCSDERDAYLSVNADDFCSRAERK